MILVDVYVPAIDDHYDFMLDENEMADKIILEIAEMVAKKTKSGKVEYPEKFILFSMEKKEAVKRGRTLYECGIKDGSSMLLV
ncbi:MAG: hypothetical protein K2O96_06520 [Lachnospiraceae bacterium]|nr:hypothetical protein [Lachnospiraceae bacterium]